MPDWRRWLEDMLPWYSRTAERLRDKRSESRARRSDVANARAERVIADYRAASKDQASAGDALIKEARRDD